MRFLLFLLAAPAFAQLSQAGGPADPVTCNNSAFLSVTSSTTTQVIAAQPGQSIYVCGFVMNAGGNTSGRLVQGDGTNCATNQANLTPAFKFVNGSSVTLGASVGFILKLAANRALCLTNTSNQDLHILVSFARF